MSKQLSKKAINEFNEIYKNEFGEGLKPEQAGLMAIALLRLFRTLSREEFQDD